MQAHFWEKYSATDFTDKTDTDYTKGLAHWSEGKRIQPSRDAPK